MSELPLEAATADIIARFKRGNDMLASAAIALRRLKERIDAGEAGPDWNWASYRTMHLEAHVTKRWINAQLLLAPPGATEAEVGLNVEKHRQTKRLGMKKSREPRGSNLTRTRAYAQAEPEYEEEVVQHRLDNQSQHSQDNTTPPVTDAGGDPLQNALAQIGAMQSFLYGKGMFAEYLDTLGSPAVAPPVKADESISPPRKGMVAYWVDPDDPVSAFAHGLKMAMTAHGVLSGYEFARCWPNDLPLLSDELSRFCDWLLVFEEEFRGQYKVGNDAALQAAE
jgi:hypothetical protein